MKLKILLVIWNDTIEFEEETLDDESFFLVPTVQTGLLYDEDSEKIRLVHSYSINHDEHDFVIIPKASIVKQKMLGFFDTEKNKVVKTNE